MDSATLKLFANDPAAFRDALVLHSAHGPRRLGDIMVDFQRRDFAELDKAFLAVRDGRKPDVGRHWWERTKGASKDTDLAIALLWLLAFCRRPLTVQVAAAGPGPGGRAEEGRQGHRQSQPVAC